MAEITLKGIFYQLCLFNFFNKSKLLITLILSRKMFLRNIIEYTTHCSQTLKPLFLVKDMLIGILDTRILKD